ncbi:MAG: cytochrome c, class I [Novosphingobium sp.]|uniref:Cytochrome c n=1 Tax=Tsuneonella suprasediminis TaxID=2306996 RepID=A0A419R4Y4_9SPHN|nr:cytochrome c [Tsuneonella suprasediminis]MAC58390.1 cytochrome c, class I [Novosphingobium sp.]RJX70340.1 cytochrome c [Tsuneonella suprasediminis]|tara:strand:+ start:899 stop:1192 length:294 start_codon:yes stop_codon:yes gene_type:complete
MKISPLPLAALVLAFSLGFSQLAPAQSADRKAEPDPRQFARGAKAWADNCGRCHNIRDPKEYSDRSWNVIVKHMRVRANISGDTADDIAAFLKASNN